MKKLIPPQKFREIVFQLLYSQDFAPLDSEESIPFMMNELKVKHETKEQALFWTFFDKRLTNIYINPTMADIQGSKL